MPTRARPATMSSMTEQPARPADSRPQDPTPRLTLSSEAAVADLEQFATRARRASDTGMRLQLVPSAGPGRPAVLAQWVSVLAPRGLGDEVPTVLGLRTVPVEAAEHAKGLDATVALAAVLERTARMKDSGPAGGVDRAFSVPPSRLNQPWTALTPPRAGWEQVADVAHEDLITVAKDGIEAMRQALPANPGEAVVQRLRAAVWGQMLGEPAVLPAGCAFAAFSLGFLPPQGRARVLQNGPWTRLDTSGGFVLHRPAVAF